MFKFKRGFVQIPSCLYQDYVHSLPLLYRIILIPPFDLRPIRNLPRRDILSRTVTTGAVCLNFVVVVQTLCAR